MADSSFYDKLHDALIDDRSRALKAHPGHGSWDVADVMAVIWPEILQMMTDQLVGVQRAYEREIEGLQQDLETSRARSKHLKELIEQIDIAAKEKWNCGNCGKECDGYCHECAKRSLEDD